MLKDKVKGLTRGSLLYFPLRHAYQAIFNRRYLAHARRVQSFYSHLISKGDLVFDVGANVGLYTEVFLGLGARVVAIEPNPECAAVLQGLRFSGQLEVECVALGASDSEGTLFLADSDTHSTLSRDWMEAARNASQYGRREWKRALRVPVTTLDGLIRKYGTPAFIKIDVEGFEQEILSGLTKLPKCLSFEFITGFMDGAIRCVRKTCFSQNALFNLTLSHPFGREPEPIVLLLDRWVSAAEIIALLGWEELSDAAAYGEIFVRDNP